MPAMPVVTAEGADQPTSATAAERALRRDQRLRVVARWALGEVTAAVALDAILACSSTRELRLALVERSVEGVVVTGPDASTYRHEIAHLDASLSAELGRVELQAPFDEAMGDAARVLDASWIVRETLGSSKSLDRAAILAYGAAASGSLREKEDIAEVAVACGVLVRHARQTRDAMRLTHAINNQLASVAATVEYADMLLREPLEDPEENASELSQALRRAKEASNKMAVIVERMRGVRDARGPHRA